MSFSLTSARTRLRRFHADDLDLVVQLESDPEVMRYTTSGMALPRAESERRLARMIEKEKEREPFGIWAAELKTGEFLGWFMLMPVLPREPELGFMILRKYWGQGYTAEVAAALLAFAARLGIERVSAVTHPENRPSIRVLEKLGFRLEKQVPGVDKAQQREILLNHYERDLG